MTLFEVIVAYTVAWWMVFFMALPIGARPPEHVERGHADSAPEAPRLWTKVAATTVIAALLVWAFHWFVTSGIMTIRPD